MIIVPFPLKNFKKKNFKNCAAILATQSKFPGLYLKLLFAIVLSLAVSCSQKSAKIIDKSKINYPASKVIDKKIDSSKVINPNSRYHEVKPGETIYSIAKLYNAKPSQLVDSNNLIEPYTIRVGQRIAVMPLFEKNLPQIQSQNKPVSNKNSNKDVSKERQNANVDNKSATQGTNQGLKSQEAKDSQSKFTSSARQPNTQNNLQNDPNQNDNKASEKVIEAKQPGSAEQPVAKTREAEDKGIVGAKSGGATSNFTWPIHGKVVSRFGPKDGGLYNDGLNISAREGTPVRAASDGVVAYVGNELKGYGNLVIVKHESGWISAYAHLKDFNVARGQNIKTGQKLATVGSSGNVKSSQLYFSLRKGKEAVNPENYLKY